MATTIQVSPLTKQLLDTIKRKDHALTYDEIIHVMAQHKLATAHSMFGKAKLRPWTKKDRMDFHEA